MTNTAARPGAYRPDIDGLRAVAVLSVIFYHINNAWVPGGYVGVDIFFVISGFLITRNIWREQQAGKFSLADFYLRRIRRIAPAFLVVTATTVAAGAFLLLPADLLRLAVSAIWASFSAANIYYWKYLDTSYFAAASSEEPLLHMWSLGVEEQFYLLWPALLMLLALASRRKWITISATALICVGSFAIAELTNVSAPKFAYYMLPARAGELMMGALLAFHACSRNGESRVPTGWWLWARELASICGLGLIAFSLWWLDDASPFPGVNALYPCLGAVLVILSGQWGSRLTHVLLTPRPAVYIGLISYSLYLWHWPILAFIRYFYGKVNHDHAVLALAAMLVLSVASYRFVEQPARRARMAPARQVLAMLALPVAVVVFAASLLVRSDGLKSMIESTDQYQDSMATLNRQTSVASRSVYSCMDSKLSMRATLVSEHCVLGAKSGGQAITPKVFLWGDSNAGHYIGTLRAIAERDGFAFRYATLSACPALFGDGEFGSPRARDGCSSFRESMRKHLLRDSVVETVVLASQWAVHQRIPGFREALDRTVEELTSAGKRVLLIGQVPGFAGYNKDCALRWARVSTARCEERQSKYHTGNLSINDYMDDLASRDDAVDYVDIHDVLCRDGQCSPYVDQAPVYFNPTHLSAAGSYLIGRKIAASPLHDPWLAAFSAVVPRSRAVLAGGYQPGFPYEIRSQRHVPRDNGLVQHVVITEYIGIDGVAVLETLQQELGKRGFSMEGPTEKGRAKRWVARRGPYDMVIDITENPAIALTAPDARGLVYFAWKDQRMR
ncbi:acyltransferase family protein [Novilysobacter erysipheiresistens]|uniref:Acyltransferase family protein n=1 Tax=Novilysobacter erysipheiresistens TaxID=1749332 RepID=A0ABU7YYV7_9GAMM